MFIKKRKLLFIFIVLLLLVKIGLEVDAYFYQKNMKLMEKTFQEQHKTLNLPTNDIHYFVSGKENKEVIVFLHPAFSNHYAFNEQVAFFAEKYKVITIDLIGHGLSKGLKTTDKIDASAHHISQILAQENIEKAHFVGVSIGGLLAQYTQFMYPQKVESLTILGAYDIHLENPEVGKKQHKMQIGMIMRMFFSLNAFRKKASKISAYKEEGKTLFYHSTQYFERKSLLLMQGLKNVVKNRENMTINCPILLLIGEHDIPLAHKMAEQWHQKIPTIQYQVIKGAGHCANMDKPTVFNEMLLTFLQSQERE